MAVCLVTGGAGFVGSHLVDALVARRHTVRVLDNFSTGSLANLALSRPSVEVMRGELADLDLVCRAAEGADFVFHVAARPLGAPPQELGADTLHVLIAARRAQVKRVIHASCSSVYGCSRRPLKETDLINPLLPAAASRWAAEQYCSAFTFLYGLGTVRLRYFNVFGPRQHPASPHAGVLHILQAMMQGKSPAVQDDGLEPFDCLHVDDVVHANLLAMTARRVVGKVYNIARGRPTTSVEVVATLNALLGTRVPARYGDPTAPPALTYNSADISRAEAELGFCPGLDLERGLRRCLDYYEARPEELVDPAPPDDAAVLAALRQRGTPIKGIVS